MANNWKDDLATTIKHTLQKPINLQQIADELRLLKDAGISHTEVREYLYSIRYTSDEAFEDRILGVLDIVEGWCQSKYIVW